VLLGVDLTSFASLHAFGFIKDTLSVERHAQPTSHFVQLVLQQEQRAATLREHAAHGIEGKQARALVEFMKRDVLPINADF
jgi:hypothetical protein